MVQGEAWCQEVKSTGLGLGQFPVPGRLCCVGAIGGENGFSGEQCRGDYGCLSRWYYTHTTNGTNKAPRTQST